MRAAPAVSLKASDSGAWLWALRVVWLISATATVLWAIERAEPASLSVAALTSSSAFMNVSTTGALSVAAGEVVALVAPSTP